MTNALTPVIDIDKPWYKSKTVWTQVIGGIAAVIARFGLDVPPEVQTIIVEVILALAGVATIIVRMWFTGKDATAPQLKAALEDKGLKVTTKPVPS